MSSAVFDKLLGRRRRDPAPEPALFRAVADPSTLAARIETLSAEVDALRARQSGVEAKFAEAIEPRGLSRDAAPGATVAGLESSIAALRVRCGEISSAQAAMTAALRRADDAMRGLQADVATRLTAADASVARDRTRVDEVAALLRELRPAVSTATQQVATFRADLHNRSDDLSRSVMSRLAPLYFMSLLAMLVSLATLAWLIWRTM